MNNTSLKIKNMSEKFSAMNDFSGLPIDDDDDDVSPLRCIQISCDLIQTDLSKININLERDELDSRKENMIEYGLPIFDEEIFETNLFTSDYTDQRKLYFDFDFSPPPLIRSKTKYYGSDEMNDNSWLLETPK